MMQSYFVPPRHRPLTGGAKFQGTMTLPFGKVQVAGQSQKDGNFVLRGAMDVKVAGFTLGNAQIEVDTRKPSISVKGIVDLGIGKIAVEGFVKSPTSFSLTGRGNVTLLGQTLASVKLAIDPSGAALEGPMLVPGLGPIQLAGKVTPSTFSLTGTRNWQASAGPFSLSGNIKVTASKTEIAGFFSGSAKLGALNLNGNASVELFPKFKVCGTFVKTKVCVP